MNRETERMAPPAGPGDGPQHGVRRGGCRPAASLPALLAALAACGAADRAGSPAGAVRDSAGIAIVESRAVPRLEDLGWRIADSPSVIIGRADGDAGDVLHQVMGALRLPDGRIVIANSGSAELRFYDAQGRFLSAAGRRGAGPGEFEFLSSLYVDGDTLLAADAAQRRVSVLAADGRFVRSFQLAASGERLGLALLGTLGEGRLAVRSIDRPGQGTATGVSRRPNVYWLYDAQGAPLDSVATLPGWEAFSLVEEGRPSLLNVPIPFGPTAQAAAGAGRLVLTDTERPEYRVYDAAGRLERIVRWTPPGPPPEVAAEEIERFKADAIGRAPGPAREGLERVYPRMPFPKTKPPLQTVRIDSEGCVWAIGWPGPGSDTRAAIAFDAEGRALGALELPLLSLIHEIGAEYVLAGVTDELGIESVHLYALERAAGCGGAGSPP